MDVGEVEGGRARILFDVEHVWNLLSVGGCSFGGELGELGIGGCCLLLSI